MYKVPYFTEKKCDCDSYSRTSVCFLVFGMVLLVYTSYHRTVDAVSVEEHLSTFFPCGSVGKESACDARNLGSIPGLGKCPGEGNGCPL